MSTYRFVYKDATYPVLSTDCVLWYRQYDVVGNRKAVVIRVPYRLSKAYRKIHVRLVRELEKKFSGKVSLGCLFFVVSI